MTKEEKLRSFINGGYGLNEDFMMLERNGIKYVFEPQYAHLNPCHVYYCDAIMIGLIIKNEFYATNYNYKDINKVFSNELAAFKERYIAEYNKLLSTFSVDNLVPVTTAAGEYDPKEEKENLDKFVQNELQHEARQIFFCGIYTDSFSMFDENYVEPFLKYLLYDEEYLRHFIKEDILRKAVEINFRIKKDKMLSDAVDKMKTDSYMMLRKTIYEKLRNTEGEKYRVKIGINHAKMDAISVPSGEIKGIIMEMDRTLSRYTLSKADRELLSGFCLAYGFDDDGIGFENIEKISYGHKTLYEKRKDVL